MAEFVTKVLIKASKETNKGVNNFYVDSDDTDSPFQMLQRLAQWMNDEFGENFQVKDLNDMNNYTSRVEKV